MAHRRSSTVRAPSHGASGQRKHASARGHNRTATISDKAREKEAALLETLQDAEMRQLETFIKKRSLELDGDIQKLQQQLHSRTTVNSVENEELAKKVLGPELGVQGVGLANADLGTNFTDSEATHVRGSPSRNVDFEAARARAPPPKRAVSDHQINFLARIKLSKHRFEYWLCKHRLC